MDISSSVDKMVFIVEDDPVQQKMLKKHFQDMVGNYSVQTFFNPDELLAHLNEKPYAIILDHYFGNDNPKTGLDYLKLIKKKFSSIPVIYYTASDDSTLPDKVLKMGAFQFIYKDVSSFVKLRTALDKIESSKGKAGFLKRLFK